MHRQMTAMMRMISEFPAQNTGLTQLKVPRTAHYVRYTVAYWMLDFVRILI